MFVRKRREAKTKSGQARVKASNWKFMDALSFLIAADKSAKYVYNILFI